MSGAKQVVLAVDLGGTKVAVAALTQEGEIHLRLEEQTNQAGPDPLIAQIARLLRTLMDEGNFSSQTILGIGVGIPAVLEPGTDFVIWGPNLQGWRNVDLRGRLQHEMELPVYVEYDGHTAVLGEWWQGAGQGYQSIAMIIVGTGIGGGLILDGRLYRGHNRLAGAAGWFALTTEPEESDPRGQAIGHWESLAAGPGIARRGASLLPSYPESSLHAYSEGELSARQIFEAARKGDTLAARVVQETGRLLGLGAANVVSLVNPQLVVLGGSIGRQPELLPGVQQVVARWAQPASASSVKILPSRLGSDAGLYGAAYAVLIRSAAPANPMKTNHPENERR